MPGILITTLGRTPQTVTEVAGELRRRGVPLSGILMIRTAGSVPVPPDVRRQLDGVNPDAWQEIDIHGPDVLTPDDARTMARTIFTVIAAQKRRPDIQRLHLDLTGGRKTMSAYMLLAAQFLLDPDDRVYHVEVDKTRFPDNRWYPEADGEVHLLDVPFIRLKPLTALMEEFGGDAFDPVATTATAIESLQRHVELGLMALGVEHETHGDLNIVFRDLEKITDPLLTRSIRARVENIDGLLRSMLAVVDPPERLTHRPVDLRDAALQAVEDMEQRSDARFTVEGDRQAVMADPLLIRRVFHMLLDNATQADARRIRVALGKEDSRATATVIDDGHGLRPEELKEAFLPVKPRLRKGRGRKGDAPAQRQR